jgi:DNA-binding MarR family transcriptional regulator
MAIQTPPLNGQDINLAARAVRDLLDALIAREGVDFEPWLLVQALGPAAGGLERAAVVADLAARLRVDPAQVSALLDGLERAGLVAHDVSRMLLTPRGHAAYERVQAGVARITPRIYGELAPEDLATTRRVLHAITERAEKLRPEL